MLSTEQLRRASTKLLWTPGQLTLMRSTSLARRDLPCSTWCCAEARQSRRRVDCGPPESIAWAGCPPDRTFSSPRPLWLGRHSVTAFNAGLLISGGGFGERHGRLVNEPRGMLCKRTIKRDLPGHVNSVHPAEMHLIRRHQTDPGMVVIPVVPIEEPAAEVPGVLNAPEPLRKPWLVFQGFEVTLGERIVVGRVRPAVRTGDAKIGQQKRGCFGLHGPPLSAQREYLVARCVWRSRPRTAAETAWRFQHPRRASRPRSG